MAGAPPTAFGAQQQEVGLSVTVVDQDGESVAGATLVANWDGGNATVTTGPNGRVNIAVPAGARVAIHVDDGEYLRNVPTVVTATAGREVTVHVAKKGAATVQVASPAGEPISGAQVVVSRNGTTIVRGATDADGTFATGPVEQGDYRVDVVEPGYYGANRTLSVNSTSTRQSLTLEPGTVSVRVRVVDDHFDDPRPVDNASVVVESVGRFDTTDGETSAFDVPVNADLDLQVTKDGYETVDRTFAIGESNGTATVAVRRTPELRVDATTTTADVGGNVTVSVTDAYGDPVDGATVRVDGEPVGTTNESGRVEFTVESTGTHNVTAVTDDLTSEPLVVEGETRSTSTRSSTDQPTVTTTATTTESTGSGPGVGAGVAALVFLATSVLLLARRR